jgi:hypothetical protein
MLETVSFKHLILRAAHRVKLSLMEDGFQVNSVGVSTWSGNWAWSLPLIVLNVFIHVFGLVFISETVVPVLSRAIEHRRFVPMFVVIMGVSALLATALHAFEASARAAAYRLLGALPDNNLRCSIRSAQSQATAMQNCSLSVNGNSWVRWRR